jgi:hypothetical protein
MIKAKRFIVAAVGGLAVGAAVQASVMPWTTKAMRWQASTSTVTAVVTPPAVTNDFTVRFLTGTFPTNLVLGLTPSVTNAAEYDPGDGVWRGFTSRTITLASGSKYISFRGAWTNASRTYEALFLDTFNSSAYTCQTEGAFSNRPTTASAYRDMFFQCKAIVSFTTNPIPLLTGAPAANMYSQFCYGMTGLTNLPADFMNTSGLTGAPAASMFYRVCYNVSGVKTLPDNFLNTASITGAPAANMLNQSCRGMSGVTNLPANFLNTSKLTGAPAANMFNQSCINMSGVTNLPAGCLDMSGLSGPPAAGMLEYACNGMSGLVSGDFNISSNVTFATTNITSSMQYAFGSMTKWTGTVYWGTNRIYDAITNPATDANVFANSTLVPGYTNMGVNWK